MDVTCDQCGASFSVEPPDAFSAHVEGVCPACFQVLSIAVPAPGLEALKGEPPLSPDFPDMVGEAEVSLMDASVAERVRDGFSLDYEVRHPRWPRARRMHVVDIRRAIYDGRFDGQEEYQMGSSGWTNIVENSEFERIFKLIAKEPVHAPHGNTGAPASRFSGWKAAQSSKTTPANEHRGSRRVPDSQLLSSRNELRKGLPARVFSLGSLSRYLIVLGILVLMLVLVFLFL